MLQNPHPTFFRIACSAAARRGQLGVHACRLGPASGNQPNDTRWRRSTAGLTVPEAAVREGRLDAATKGGHRRRHPRRPDLSSIDEMFPRGPWSMVATWRLPALPILSRTLSPTSAACRDSTEMADWGPWRLTSAPLRAFAGTRAEGRSGCDAPKINVRARSGADLRASGRNSSQSLTSYCAAAYPSLHCGQEGPARAPSSFTRNTDP